jgi:hypothetical protein
MLPRSPFARYALVAAVAALVALALSTTGATAHNDGFNERIVNCIETGDANSDQCIAALEVSTVDSNFFRVLADNLDNVPSKEEPEPEVAEDQMTGMMKTCLELKASLNGKTASELHDLVEKVNYACKKALIESHMSAAQFWNKYR